MLDMNKFEDEKEMLEYIDSVYKNKDVSAILELADVQDHRLDYLISNLNPDQSYILEIFKYTRSLSRWRAIMKLDFARRDPDLIERMFKTIPINQVNDYSWFESVVEENRNYHHILLENLKSLQDSGDKSGMLKLISILIEADSPHIYNFLNEINEEDLDLSNNIKIANYMLDNFNLERYTINGIFEAFLENSMDRINYSAVRKATNRFPDLRNPLHYILNYYPRKVGERDLILVLNHLDDFAVSLLKSILDLDNDVRLKLTKGILDNIEEIHEYNAIRILSSIAKYGDDRVQDLLVDSSFPEVRMEVLKSGNYNHIQKLKNDKNPRIRSEAAKYGEISDIIDIIENENDPGIMIEIAKLRISETFDALIEKDIEDVNTIIADKCSNEQLERMNNLELLFKYSSGYTLLKAIESAKHIGIKESYILNNNENMEEEHLKALIEKPGIVPSNDLLIKFATDLGEEGLKYVIEFLENTNNDDNYRDVKSKIEDIKEIYASFK